MHGHDATNTQGLYPLMFGTRERLGMIQDIRDIKWYGKLALWIVTIIGSAILVALANMVTAQFSQKAQPVSVINVAPAANAMSATDSPKDAKAN